MPQDPASSVRSRRRGLSLGNQASIDAPGIEDTPPFPRASKRRPPILGDPADATPVAREAYQSTSTAAHPQSLQPDALQLLVGLGAAGVVTAQAISQSITVPSAGSGAVLVLLQASGPVFVALLTIVVLRGCQGLRGRAAARFWISCVVASALTYLAWSALYFVADGGRPRTPLAAAESFAHDLLTGSTNAHLELVLVAVQLCLVIPVVRWLMRVTRGRHLLLFAASFVAELAVTVSMYWLLPISEPARLLPGYFLFVVMGALLVEHRDEIRERMGRHPGVWIACLATGILVAEASYGIDLARHVAPGPAAQSVQPAIMVTAAAAVIGLAAAAARWEARPRPSSHLHLLAAWFDAVTGVYLVAPLLVLVGLAVLYAGSTGGPDTTRIVLGLVCGVPLLLATSWLLATGLRRSPLSIPLTGRRRVPPAGPDDAGRRMVKATAGVAGLALLLVAAIGAEPSPLGSAGGGRPAGGSLVGTTRTVAPAAADTYTTIHSIAVQGLSRRYEVIQPQHPVSSSLPVLVFLGGGSAELTAEENRDGLLPYASAGEAILVYPAGFDESWNAGTCCSAANRHGVDDIAFLTDVVRASAKMRGADPKLVYVAGYGAGGRMAYDLICHEPRLATGAVVIAAVPATTCPAGRPVPLLQVAASNDPSSPYQQVVQQVRRWVKRNGCPTTASGDDAYAALTLKDWSACAHGSRVEFATYAGAGDDLFGGNGSPPLARVMMSFVKHSPFTG